MPGTSEAQDIAWPRLGLRFSAPTFADTTMTMEAREADHARDDSTHCHLRQGLQVGGDYRLRFTDLCELAHTPGATYSHHHPFREPSPVWTMTLS
jgi:hypothetical protein